MKDTEPTEAKTLKVSLFYFFWFIALATISSQAEKYIPYGNVLSGFVILFLPSYFVVYSLKKNNQFITSKTIIKAIGGFSLFFIFMFISPIFLPDVKFDLTVVDALKYSGAILLAYTVPVSLFMIWLTKSKMFSFPRSEKVALEAELSNGAIYYLIGAFAVLGLVMVISWGVLAFAQ